MYVGFSPVGSLRHRVMTSRHQLKRLLRTQWILSLSHPREFSSAKALLFKAFAYSPLHKFSFLRFRSYANIEANLESFQWRFLFQLNTNSKSIFTKLNFWKILWSNSYQIHLRLKFFNFPQSETFCKVKIANEKSEHVSVLNWLNTLLFQVQYREFYFDIPKPGISNCWSTLWQKWLNSLKKD